MSVILHVGSKPAPFVTRATYFDGVTGVAREVDLRIDERRKALVGTGVDWPLEDIRELPDVAGDDLLILRWTGDPVARLVLTDDQLRLRLPHPEKRAPPARRGRLFAWAVAAVSSVALILFVLVPLMADQLAEYLPLEGEQALGEVTLNQIRGALDETGSAPIRFCTEPYGEAALTKMADRLLDAMDPPVALRLHVLDHEMVNAFALPGGNVVLFRGLIEEAGAPEQVAAVLAHEIGHVVSRDPTRHALRSAGSLGVLGLVFGDFAGGAIVLFLTEQLIEAQYSQKAEAAADLFAHDLMRRAQMRPDALADMFVIFKELGGEASAFLQHFQAHPGLGDRIDAARSATPDGFVRRDLLTEAEWQDLRGICAGEEAY